MPARRYELVCDSRSEETMRQRLLRQKIRNVSLYQKSPGAVDKPPASFSELTVMKSPRGPTYEVQYVKTKKDGITKVPVVRLQPKKPPGKGGGDKEIKAELDRSDVGETGSIISEENSDVNTGDMVGLRVIACNKKDGLYYPGTVASHLEATYALVNFNFNKRQRVRTHMIIPMSGAIARPELAPGDFVLVKVFKQEISLDCYVPALIEFVPEDFRAPTKFYSVLLYNGQRASTMRTFIVKIGRSRFELAVNYIAHIQSVERQKRAYKDDTPRSEDTEVTQSTNSRSDRMEDVLSDHSSVRSNDRSSLRSGSERGRKKKEKLTKKLVQKQKEQKQKHIRSESRSKIHSRSSSRSNSRSRSRCETKSKKHSRSSSRSKSRSRSRSYSRSTSRSRSRSDSEGMFSRTSENTQSSSKRENRRHSKRRPNSRSRSRTRSLSDSERTISKSLGKANTPSRKGGRPVSRQRSRRSSYSRSKPTTRPMSRSRTRSWSKSESEKTTPRRRTRSWSESSTERTLCCDDDMTPRASPVERPKNPVAQPKPSVSEQSPGSPRRSQSPNISAVAVQFDEKDQVIGDLQYQLNKQLRKQLRQERRLIRQARKINKIQRKLNHSNQNDSVTSDKTDRSKSAKSSSDTDGSTHRRQERPDGTSSPDHPSARKGVSGFEFEKEVLARWSDDGWYYRGRVLKTHESNFILMDTNGHMEEIPPEDILTDDGHKFGVIQPQDCVIALHPKYVFSYAPGEVLHAFDNGELKVEFYDGTLSKVTMGEVHGITREKFKKDVEYIVEKERELVGKSVVAREDRTGTYRLGVVDSRVGLAQQYYIKWLDGDMCKQTSTHVFEVSLRRTQSDSLEHVLAPTDDRGIYYKPAVVLQREPLNLQFCDGYSNSEARKEQCFWISKEYYSNALEYYLSRQEGHRS